jgi:hypothetical protein
MSELLLKHAFKTVIVRGNLLSMGIRYCYCTSNSNIILTLKVQKLLQSSKQNTFKYGIANMLISFDSIKGLMLQILRNTENRNYRNICSMRRYIIEFKTQCISIMTNVSETFHSL